MVSIVADSADVERCLQRILALATRCGAEFGDHLTIRYAAGDFAIEAPPDAAGRVLARFPRDRLVPIAAFRFRLEADDVVIASPDPGLPREQIQLMDAMLALFNLAKKPAQHRRTSPWSLIASHPEIVPEIVPRRASADAAQFIDFIAAGNLHDLMLNSFLRTRVYSDKVSNAAAPPLVLMPIIDALNHHIDGRPFANECMRERYFLSIRQSRPLPGKGRECFACYGLRDGFDTWMTYNFIDADVSFVRSIAMAIDLPGWGRIGVESLAQAPTSDRLPDAVKDLRFHIPQILARHDGQLTVSGLLIPGPRAPMALRRTLDHLLSEWRPAGRNRADAVLRAEEQVVAANRSYYRSLARSLQALSLRDEAQRPILDGFARLCDLQLARIERYASRPRAAATAAAPR